MFAFVDESGNTGLRLFDPDQPHLYYGVLTSRKNIDLLGRSFVNSLQKRLNVRRLHANELGVARLTTICDPLINFSKTHDLRFSLYTVAKKDHAIICFFDQVFDSGLNDAVPPIHYWTPLRYILLLKVSALFDDDLANTAWAARIEQNPARSAAGLQTVCAELLTRLHRLPDKRSQDLISGALKWATKNTQEISYGASNRESTLQLSPNLIGFQQVLQGLAQDSARREVQVRRIVVDRQSEFNAAQQELAEYYRALRGYKRQPGPGMPTFDWSNMPEVPPTFLPGDQSPGLELVDITLWIAKRLIESKPVSKELEELFWTQAKRGYRDEVSLAAINRRWQHLLDLPEPDSPLPPDMTSAIEEMERRRQYAVSMAENQ